MLIPDALHNSSTPAVYDAAAQRWWSYAQLCTAAQVLQSQLPVRKCLAFCFCDTDVTTILNYLALRGAGHAVALLSADNAIIHQPLIERYQPELLLASRPLPFATDGYDSSAHDSSLVYKAAEEAITELDQDLAVLLSTSGTTGSPKFVRLSERNVQSNADSIRQALAITADDRAMCSLPFQYSYGLSVLNSHLRAGASLVVTPYGMMNAEYWSACREAECTSMAGVPYSYQVLHRLRLDDLRVPCLRTLTQAGGKLNTELIAKFHQIMEQRQGRYFVMYGQTEATARMAILPATDLPRKLGSAGLPIPGGRFAIKREDGALTQEGGVPGELVYSGPNVMLGYASERADLANGDELGGTLATGDLCQLDEEGYLFVAGRMKRDAKVLGMRINLDEVEAMLRKNGPTAVVAGVDKLYVFCEYGAQTDLAALRLQLAIHLKLNHAAFEFRRMEKLPTTQSGKIDYAAIQNL
jgi:acyl-coenzyme A synthetase/AMP-(fatty) acid ligase